jgi:hypothetical protein
MLAVYRHQRPDRRPLAIYTRYLPRGAAERAVRNLGLGVIEYCPVVTMLAPPWHIGPGYLSEVRGAEFEIRYSYEDGERIETRIYRTPVGDVWQQTRKDPAYGSDWVSRFYIQSREDYRTMRYIVDHTVIRTNATALKRQMADVGSDGVVLGRMDRCPYQKLLIELAGPERFLVDLQTDPEPLLELMDAMERQMDVAFSYALESDAEVIWQPDNVTADMTPPRMFQKYCLPYYEKHGAECRQAGKPYYVHMDGRTRGLKDLIAQAPIDGVESFSLPIIGGDLPYAEALNAWPGKVVLPNFPSSLCLEGDDVILHFIDELLNQAPAGEPFMLQVSEDIPADEWQRVVPLLAERFAR